MAGSDPKVDLDRHAELSALIAEGDRSTRQVLEAHELSEDEWNEASLYWARVMAEDVREHQAEATLPHRYSESFARAQDAIRPAPSWSREAWDELRSEVEASGELGQVLAAHGLSLADYFRLLRKFASAAPQGGG